MTSLPDDILDLLTAYALGALEPEEIARVSALLEQRPELRATLAELRATADRLPYGLPEAIPPDDLRQRVLDHAIGRTRSAPQSVPRSRVKRARLWLLSLGGIAAAAVLAAAIGWAQLVGTRAELANVQAELAAARADLASAQTELKQTQIQIVEAQKVIASLQGATGSAAILQTRGGEAVLVAQLPPLRPGRVYQLWRIQDGSNPASAGIFRVNPQGYVTAALPPGQLPQMGETIAVTDEPDGGSPGPTSDPLIVGKSSQG
jgi:anti-sigma-K factor RskA